MNYTEWIQRQFQYTNSNTLIFRIENNKKDPKKQQQSRHIYTKLETIQSYFSIVFIITIILPYYCCLLLLFLLLQPIQPATSSSSSVVSSILQTCLVSVNHLWYLMVIISGLKSVLEIKSFCFCIFPHFFPWINTPGAVPGINQRVVTSRYFGINDCGVYHVNINGSIKK